MSIGEARADFSVLSGGTVIFTTETQRITEGHRVFEKPFALACRFALQDVVCRGTFL